MTRGRSSWPSRTRLAAALSVLACACGRAGPDARDGAQVLRHEIEAQARDIVQLAGFAQTGERRSMMLGVSWYTMDYAAQIAFLKDACYGGGVSAREYVTPRYDPSGFPAADDPGAACHRVRVAKGERRDVTGSLMFEKLRAGGWRGPDGRIY